MKNRGVVILSPAKDPSVRLLCLAHAGGSAASYGEWAPLFPADVEVCAFELPGRGGRSRELPLTSMAEIVDHVMALSEPLVDTRYVVCGHSMGAVIALELTRRWSTHGRPPQALVVSGCRAPHLPRRRDKPLSELPTDQLLRELSLLQGLPHKMLQMPSLMETFLPAIRADLRCREHWSDTTMSMVDVPIHALGGRDDKSVPYADLQAWQRYSDRPIQVRMFDGGHFFIRDSQAQFIHYLMQVLHVREHSAAG